MVDYCVTDLSISIDHVSILTWWNVVHFGDQEAKQAVDLMRRWAPIDIADALELLSPVFESEEVSYCCTLLVPHAGFVFDLFSGALGSLSYKL